MTIFKQENEIKDVKIKVDSLEQNNLCNNLCIFGVTNSQNESTLAVIKEKVLSTLNVSLRQEAECFHVGHFQTIKSNR